MSQVINIKQEFIVSLNLFYCQALRKNKYYIFHKVFKTFLNLRDEILKKKKNKHILYPVKFLICSC